MIMKILTTELKGKCSLLVGKKTTIFITGIFLFLEGRLAYNIEQWDESRISQTQRWRAVICIMYL